MSEVSKGALLPKDDDVSITTLLLDKTGVATICNSGYWNMRIMKDFVHCMWPAGEYLLHYAKPPSPLGPAWCAVTTRRASPICLSNPTLPTYLPYFI